MKPGDMLVVGGEWNIWGTGDDVLPSYGYTKQGMLALLLSSPTLSSGKNEFVLVLVGNSFMGYVNTAAFVKDLRF